jgi:UDP-glucuronate 4-epimerase
MSKILVTGAAGFIGFHVSQALLKRGDVVIGIDNLNDYYDVNLKQSRLALLQAQSRFQFRRADIGDRAAMEHLFTNYTFDRVIHLAAQAGVRYSLQNPHAYGQSNLIGFLNILEGCRHQQIQHLVFASSSSVYGANRESPFSVQHSVDHPVSLYAATKKSNEMMAHAYSHLYGLPITGLRFFTVYGPWGRPDMALFSFTKAILEERPIDVFNHGKMKRDFTYIDDVVDGVLRTCDRPPVPNPLWSEAIAHPGNSAAPYRIYNLGNHQPVELSYFIQVLENSLGCKAEKNLLPMQPGDVLETYADISSLKADTGYQPRTPIEVGIPRFVEWYCRYYGVSSPLHSTLGGKKAHAGAQQTPIACF